MDWAAARPTLQPLVDDASIVLTTDELAVLYYLGRFDVTVSGSRMSEVRGAHEFSPDDRTGRPMVSSAELVERIMACFPHGLLLTNTSKWRNPAQVDNQVADAIERYAQPVEVPKGSHIVAFTWGKTDLAPPPDGCASLPALRAPE